LSRRDETFPDFPETRPRQSKSGLETVSRPRRRDRDFIPDYVITAGRINKWYTPDLCSCQWVALTCLSQFCHCRLSLPSVRCAICS